MEEGVYVEKLPLTLRSVTSDNRVPALVVADQGGHVTLLDSTLNGGAAGVAAIQNSGAVFLRNLRQTGYGQFVNDARDPAKNVDGAQLGEYSSDAAHTLFETAPQSLNLPIENTPEVAWDDPKDWVKVEPGGSVQIQAAFDRAAREGKTTVYFPNRAQNANSYPIDRTIRVHGGVRRIIGMDNVIFVANPLLESGDAVFRFENLSAPAVIFERFYLLPARPKEYSDRFKQDNFIWFDHASPTSLVLSSLNGMQIGRMYRGNKGAGKLFVDDMVGTGYDLVPGQKAYFRQFNPEHYYKSGIINDGAQLVILGLKTEGYMIAVETLNGGQTEVFGGLIYPAWTPRALPMPGIFVVNNGSLFVSVAGSAYDAIRRYPTFVSETQRGQGRELPQGQLSSNGRSYFNVAAFVSRASDPNAPRTRPISPLLLAPETLVMPKSLEAGLPPFGPTAIIGGQKYRVAGTAKDLIFLEPVAP